MNDAGVFEDTFAPEKKLSDVNDGAIPVTDLKP